MQFNIEANVLCSTVIRSMIEIRFPAIFPFSNSKQNIYIQPNAFAMVF